MKANQLNQILRVVRHTGDRVVVVDPETDDVVVLMPFSEYEAMLHEPFDSVHDFFETGDDSAAGFSDEVGSLVFEEKHKEKPINSRYNAVKKHASVPQQTESLEFDDEAWSSESGNFLAEESLKDVPEDEVEEKFYLEPIES